MTLRPQPRVVKTLHTVREANLWLFVHGESPERERLDPDCPLSTGHFRPGRRSFPVNSDHDTDRLLGLRHRSGRVARPDGFAEGRGGAANYLDRGRSAARYAIE